ARRHRDGPLGAVAGPPAARRAELRSDRGSTRSEGAVRHRSIRPRRAEPRDLRLADLAVRGGHLAPCCPGGVWGAPAPPPLRGGASGSPPATWAAPGITSSTA